MKYIKRLLNIIKNIFSRFGYITLTIIVFLSLSLFCALIIALPFYYFGKNFPEIFQSIYLYIIIGLLAFSIVFNFIKGYKKEKNIIYALPYIFPKWLRFVLVILFLAFGVPFLITVWIKSPLIAVPLTITGILGIIVFFNLKNILSGEKKIS